MKKKYRELTTDSGKYGWIVKSNYDGSGNHLLRIYKDKVIIKEVIIPPGVEVTPKTVSNNLLVE